MNIKDYLRPYIHPALEATGVTVGGLLAAPTNIVAPGIAEALGIGLGVTGGSKLADIVDHYLYDEQVKPLSESLPETVKDVGYNTLGATLPNVLSAAKNKAVKPFTRGIWDSILKQSKDLPEMIVRPSPVYKDAVEKGLNNAGNLNASEGLFSKMMGKYQNMMAGKTPMYAAAAEQGKTAPQGTMQKVLDFIEAEKGKPNLTPDELKDLDDLYTTAKGASTGEEIGSGIPKQYRTGNADTEITPEQIDSFKSKISDYNAKTGRGEDIQKFARKNIIDPEMEEVIPGYTAQNKRMGIAEGIGEEGKFYPKNEPTGVGNDAFTPQSPEISAPKVNQKDTYFDLSDKDLGDTDADALRQYSEAIDYQNLPDDMKAQFLAKERLSSKATAGFAQRMLGKAALGTVLPGGEAATGAILGTSQKLLNTGLGIAGKAYRPAYSLLKKRPLGILSSMVGQENRNNKFDEIDDVHAKGSFDDF